MKRGIGRRLSVALTLGFATSEIIGPAAAQEAEVGPARYDEEEVARLRQELMTAKAEISRQNKMLSEQQRRLDLLEQRLTGVAQVAQQAREVQLSVVDSSAAEPNATRSSTRVRVGEPPRDSDRPPTVAVLDQRGSVVTKRGELVAELGFDYTRADRNRAVFRGVELLESVLVGIFDINESRQDIVTGSASVRYGLTDRFEIGARVPWIYRSDKLITAPVPGSTNNDPARTIDNSVSGSGLGDIELTARYQINDGGRNVPFLIANLQATLPTGRDPFSVERDELGVAQEVSTGAGFLGITPSITAILPSEPAVLFGTVGYTFNLSKDIETRIPPVQIERIEPGDQINVSAGIGLALNERTSLNFGYNHAWSFGTTTAVRRLDERSGEPVGELFKTTTRDLQIGRFLFGVSHKFSKNLQINWSVEVGATEDAPDLKTSLRIPFRF
jgi:hypothetical protein